MKHGWHMNTQRLPEPYGPAPLWKMLLKIQQQGHHWVRFHNHTHTYICKNSAVSVDERKGRSNPDGANAVGLHLWLIMSNTLEASPPQLLPRHKSHTSGPLIPRCWTLVAGKHTHKHTQSPYVYTLKFMQSHTNSFINAYSDLFLSVWLPKYTM